MKRINLIIFVVLLIAVFTWALGGCASISKKMVSNIVEEPSTTVIWNEVRSGLSYAKINVPVAHVVSESQESVGAFSENIRNMIMVKVDPLKYHFSVYQNKDQENAKSIKDISTETAADLVFNGGYFTEDFKPTGLLISESHRLRKQSFAGLLNGTFVIDQGGMPHLIAQEAPFDEKLYSFAIQNGPILIDENGVVKITKDTGKTASRTAIGLDKDNHIVIILIRQTLFNSENSISLFDFAHLLKESAVLKSLGLHSILNLDGGTSSGMIVGQEYFPELEKVQNVIVVNSKSYEGKNIRN